MLANQATAKMNFARIWCIPNPTPAERLTPPRNVYMAKFDPGWEGYPVWQIRLPALAGHPTYHINVINLKWEIIWTGGLPPPKRVTSPTWSPPPPCKQALRSFWKFHVVVVQNNGKEMYQKKCCTCKVAFLLIRPIVVFHRLRRYLPSPLSITRF